MLLFVFTCSSSEESSLAYDENADPDQDGIINLYEDLNQDGDPKNDDSDGDGEANYRDPDDDNDGILTILEDTNENGSPLDDDSDYDGIPNYLDTVLFADWMNGEWKLISVNNSQYIEDVLSQKLALVDNNQMSYVNYYQGSGFYDLCEGNYFFEGKIIVNFPYFQFHKKYFDLSNNLIEEKISENYFNKVQGIEEYLAYLPLKFTPDVVSTPSLYERPTSKFNNIDTLKFASVSTGIVRFDMNYKFVKQ